MTNTEIAQLLDKNSEIIGTLVASYTFDDGRDDKLREKTINLLFQNTQRIKELLSSLCEVRTFEIKKLKASYDLYNSPQKPTNSFTREGLAVSTLKRHLINQLKDAINDKCVTFFESKERIEAILLIGEPIDKFCPTCNENILNKEGNCGGCN